METIVEKFILQLEAQLAERKVAFTLDSEARVWLAKKGFDPVYGARPLARVIQQEVRNPLTDEILFGRLEHGGHVRIRLENDKLVFDVDGAAEKTEPQGSATSRRQFARPACSPVPPWTHGPWTHEPVDSDRVPAASPATLRGVKEVEA